MLTIGTAVIRPDELARVERVHEADDRRDRRVLAAVDPAEQAEVRAVARRRSPRSTGARAPRAARGRSGSCGARSSGLARSELDLGHVRRGLGASRRSGTPPTCSGAGTGGERRVLARAQSGGCAIGQRGWKRQPLGRRIGLGGSPTTAAAVETRPGTSFGTARSRPCVYGWRASVNSSSVGAVSTIRPRYMTATRSQTWRTTAMLCAISSTVRPSCARSSSSRFSTVACTETSSAETGSSATSTSGSSASARAMLHALALAARELARIGVERPRAEADEVEQLAAARVDLRLRDHLVRAQQLGERLPHGHARVERRVRILEHHLDPPPRRARRASRRARRPR